MCIKISGLRIRIGFFAAVFFAVMFNLPSGGSYAVSVAVIVFHEAVHLIFLCIFGCKKAIVDIIPGGICIRAQGIERLDYLRTALCALSAPFFNILVAVIIFAFPCGFDNEKLFDVASVNAVIGFLNLLPLPFLDGGRATEAFLSRKKSESDTKRIMKFITFICVFIMGTGLIVLYATGNGNFFAVIFFLYCIYNLFSRSGKMKREDLFPAC